jgi:hypothetical protein
MKQALPFFVILIVLSYAIYWGGNVVAFLEENSLPPTPIEKQIPNLSSVELLNGCGVSGLADNISKYLRDNLFDVKSTDNAHGPDGRSLAFNYPKTLVISRIPDTKMAQRVAELLGVNEVVFIRTDHSSYDITIIIGHNYRELTYE